MEPITPEVLATHNLTPEEFNHIKELLEREPNLVELGVFSVMWSEHCSYKSSRIHLKRLPTAGERVIVPPGENAGVVDVGDGWCACFKIESHNHPSFIEPFQGAATGVGGILRDIFTMGARPIAALNSLRFGSLDDPKHGRRNRSLLAGAVAGIEDMGAAGLTCSTCEMAARAGTGIQIDLSLVPQRETGMTAYEMLLSESQERMLIVAHKGREREVIDIFAKWDLDAVIIGQVRDDNRMRVSHNGEVVCDVPVKALTDEAPIYQREMRAIVSSFEFRVSSSENETGLSESQGIVDDSSSGGDPNS